MFTILKTNWRQYEPMIEFEKKFHNFTSKVTKLFKPMNHE